MVFACMKTRFNTEARGNSGMAYWKLNNILDRAEYIIGRVIHFKDMDKQT